MNVESYIIIRRPNNYAPSYLLGVGNRSDLVDRVAFFEYDRIDDIIPIHDYYADGAIGTWHENIDEQIFSRFDSSDLAITLSLLGGDYSPPRRPTPETFYQKLNDHLLYRRLQTWLEGLSVQDKFEQWELSLYLPELGKSFWGLIDKDSVIIDEGQGTVSFSVYDGMKVLETIPVGAASEGFYSDQVKWRRVIPADEAFKWVWNEGDYFRASRFLPQFDYNIKVADYPIDFTGWMLSFENVDDDIVDLSKKIIDFRWDGSYLWALCEGGTDYKISIDADENWTWAATTELDEGNNLPFYGWEAQTPVNVVPDSTGLITRLARDIPSGIDFSDLWHTAFDYQINRLFVSFRDPVLEVVRLARYDFAGYTAGGEPIYNIDGMPFTVFNQDDFCLSSVANNLFWARGSVISILDATPGVGTSSVIPNILTGKEYRGLNYIKGINKLVNTRYDSGAFECFEIRNGTTGARESFRNGEIEPLHSHSDYNLDWEDIDTKSLFEVSIDDFAGGGTADIYIAGYTKRAPIRFFLLTSDFTRCVYYTNLEQAIGMPLGSQCYITRRLKSEVRDFPWGSETVHINYIHGYVGDGTIGNGVFFSYRVGSTGNIRVLNCDGMSMADFMAGLATFSNSYFFVRNGIYTDSDGRNIAYPEINLIDRNELDEDSVGVWYLDKKWTDWKVKPKYQNMVGVVNVKFNGGEVKVGARPEVTLGTGLDWMDLSNFASGVKSISMECPFVFDLNYAQWIGAKTLSFLWQPRQEWTIEAKMDALPYKLLDRVWMHAIDAPQVEKQAIIISVNYDPLNSQSATITAITVDKKNTYYPDNPIVNAPDLQQVGNLPPVS